MAERVYPTEVDIRRALITRMQAFCAATETAPSMVCRRAMNDSTFWMKIEAGGNFTVATYQKLHDYMDAHWPRTAKKKTNGGVPARKSA